MFNPTSFVTGSFAVEEQQVQQWYPLTPLESEVLKAKESDTFPEQKEHRHLNLAYSLSYPLTVTYAPPHKPEFTVSCSEIVLWCIMYFLFFKNVTS